MELSLKTRAKVKIRKLYKRSNKIIKPLRQTSALQRKPSKHTEITQPADVKEFSSRRPVPTIVTYPVPGHNTVRQISYIEPQQNTDKGIVWINQSQYFENVPNDVWNFCLGNYCVCQKWLKAREGTTLDRQSIQDYQRLVTLVSETINLINNVDSQLVDD
ncbi:hypothetical protein IQ255_04820 [Pleurocapsales cyanobacterium LEGE 10410]|nr:hypothetical protein [Pleurocapsales cyanobacterium LEGE 10410]